MTTATAWATDSSIEDRFRPSLVQRARRRLSSVTQLDEDSWQVDGILSLGDEYDFYVVAYDADLGPRGKYFCSCYGHTGGDSRSRRICSHVLAVILFRRQAGRDGEGGVSALPTEEARISPLADPAPSPSPPPSIPSPHDELFGQPPLPAWVDSFRVHQWTAIEEVMDAYRRGAKVVFLDAPTGAGKTLIAETSRRLAQGSGLYVCTTKTLQDQMVRDYDYASVLKGRSNYPTLSGFRDSWGASVDVRSAANTVTCADCTRQPGTNTCRWCPDVHSCPYVVARQRALRNSLAILNTAYALTDWNKAGGKFAGRSLAIMDEADTLEDVLMGQVEVHVGKRRQKELKILPPAKKTVEESWLEWVKDEAQPKVRAALRELPDPADPSTPPTMIRRVKGLADLRHRLTILEDELPHGGWVYDGYKQGDITFKPVRVNCWGRMIWDHAERFLLMSATIISPDEMAESLGLEDQWEVVQVPMTFPVENRPIHVAAVAEMNSKNQEHTWPKMATAVSNIIGLHEGERVLVHAVSYKLADHLHREVQRRWPGRTIVKYGSSREKDDALRRYLATEGAVMIAPSMDRGVDLPGDACRVQIVAKIPFPNLGDKQVNARLYGRGGQEWYAVQTVRSLVQMTGRGIRSETDRAVTYICDHQFTTNIWRKSRGLLPKWWQEALNWRFDVRKIL